MKRGDFSIGTEFFTSTGQLWRCTDVGSRTILAIEIKPELDASWFNGPTYAVPEVPFDEDDIAGAYRDEQEAVREAVSRFESSVHPGFPSEDAMVMITAATLEENRWYPRKGLLRGDRVSETGQILHPYAAIPVSGGWAIGVYDVFSRTFADIAEADFVRWPLATEEDLRVRRALAGKA